MSNKIASIQNPLVLLDTQASVRRAIKSIEEVVLQAIPDLGVC